VDELNSLSILASETGKFVWDETQGSPTLTDSPNIDQWNPLMTAANLGCLVEKGTLLGWIAPGNKIHLTAIVSEQDARIIELGAKVVCKWDCELSQTYEGFVTQVSTEPIDELPRPLAGDPHYYSYAGMNNPQAQQQRYYQVTVALDRWPAGVTHLSLSSTHIFTGNRTLWEIIVRYFILNVRPVIENQ
jgi:HlyD family secretion protein